MQKYIVIIRSRYLPYSNGSDTTIDDADEEPVSEL